MFLAGVLRFPHALERSRSARVRTVLDGLTILIGGGAVLWYVVLGPNAYSDQGNLLGSIVGVTYPTDDLVLIAALALLLLRGRTAQLRVPLRLLAAGVALYVVADVVYGWKLLHGGYMGGHLLDLGWLVAAGLFALAACAQEPATVVTRERAEERKPAFAAAAALPYVAVAAVFGLLIAAHRHDAFFPGLSLAITATVVGALVSVRQYLARRDAVRAHDQLRVAHAELAALATTDALTGLPNHRALVAAIDRAMYTAKRLGRNQVFDAADPAVGALPGEAGERAELDERATMGAVEALALLVAARDSGTGAHTEHVAALARRIALALGCTAGQARRVLLAAKLHDVGKVAVPDAILRKPEPLTEAEWTVMRRHPAIGADIVARIGRLSDLAPIIHAHHEHWDGSGYPDGLAGERIPLEARIVGVADAYDAMTSDRPYQRRIGADEARAELRRGAGTQFDPAVVAAFERVAQALRAAGTATRAPRRVIG